MAYQQTAVGKLLTLALLSIVFLSQVLFAFGDLAPNEDDEDVKPPTDLKKPDDTMTTLEPPKVSNLGFIHAFIASFSVIIVSEIGDKTFFIAAIMSMVTKNQNLILCITPNINPLILEISSSHRVYWSHLSTGSYDSVIGRLRYGVHPVYPTKYYSLVVGSLVPTVWTENASRRLENECDRCC